MATISTGQSNWANASARGKARKAGLIDDTRMRQLLQQSPDSIAASIAEFGYREELDEYADKLSGVDLVEAALNHNMDRDLNQVLAFCQGHLKGLVSIYVERFTYQKVKTALRAIHSGVSLEVVSSRFCPSRTRRTSDGWNSSITQIRCKTRSPPLKKPISDEHSSIWTATRT